MSIRARITIGSLIVAIIVSGGGLLAVRANVQWILQGADYSLANGDLLSFAKDILSNPGEGVDSPAAGVLLLVKDPSGVVKVDTMPHDLSELIRHGLADSDKIRTTDEGTSYVIVSRTVTNDRGEWTLWAARSAAASDLAVDGLDRSLLIGELVLLLVFGVASWLLATAALRPVSRLRKEAESLSGDAGEELLPVGPAEDEISALATTLNAFLERVRASTEREKQMVSDAAHELRTPLAALRTQLELAHDSFDDPAALAAEVRGAEDSVARLSALANGLLELSRLEGSPAERRPATSAALVDEAMGSVDRARLLGLARSVEVGFDTDDLDPADRFSIAPEAFARVLDNLLSNAIAAVGPDGSVELTIRETAEGIEVQVSDDGPGIPPSFLPVAFDRFSRPDDSRTASTGGSGLGLALVRAIAESAGGTAQLHNGDVGAIATVRIPRIGPSRKM
nr:HAMP domain-containing sensor histidine kinase [Galbitalea soli]